MTIVDFFIVVGITFISGIAGGMLIDLLRDEEKEKEMDRRR